MGATKGNRLSKTNDKSKTGEKKTVGNEGRRSGAVFLGFAKPDDPIYKEGYSIHIGPLLGTVPMKQDVKPDQNKNSTASSKTK